jgi:hypothetical protein
MHRAFVFAEGPLGGFIDENGVAAGEILRGLIGQVEQRSVPIVFIGG